MREPAEKVANLWAILTFRRRAACWICARLTDQLEFSSYVPFGRSAHSAPAHDGTERSGRSAGEDGADRSRTASRRPHENLRRTQERRNRGSAWLLTENRGPSMGVWAYVAARSHVPIGPAMKEEQWRAAWELFQASVDVPREQVEAFLGRSTISPDVRDMVERM